MNGNIITLTCTVQESRGERQNPHVITPGKFAAVNVRVPSEKGSAFLDVVGANGVSDKIGKLSRGDTFVVTGRLDSHKGTAEGATWRVRLWADDVELVE
jgi:hypothetical protein